MFTEVELPRLAARAMSMAHISRDPCRDKLSVYRVALKSLQFHSIDREGKVAAAEYLSE